MDPTTTQSSEELQAQIDDLRQRHHAAIERVDRARDTRHETSGRRVLGEVDEEELAAAHKALVDAEDVASALASALALVEGRLAEARERERDERRATLASEADATAQRRSKGLRSLDKALSSVRDALRDIDDADADSGGIRSAMIGLHDLDDAEAALTQRYADLYARLKRDAPKGMEPHDAALDLRFEGELRQLREAAEAEAAAIAPEPEDDEIAGIVDSYSEIALRLLDSRTRTILAQGSEFIQHPRAARGVTDNRFIGNTTERLYGQDEFDHARDRFDAMQSLIERLAGPLPPVDARHRKVA